MTTTVTMDLVGVNAAQPNTANMVMLVAAVNPEGSYIGSSGGGGGGNVNLSQVGGTAYSLGQKAMASSLPVVLASDSPALTVSGTVSLTGTPAVTVSGTVSDNLAQVGGSAITLGNKANAASLPVTIASEQIAAMSAFAFVAGSTQTINATTTSANTALGAAATGVLQIANIGTVVAFVALGTSAQTASTASYPILPGATVVIGGGNATNIAAMTASGTATLYVSRGTGL